MKFSFDATRFGSGLDGAVDLASARGISAVEYSFAPFAPAKSNKKQDAEELAHLSGVHDMALAKGVDFACLNLDFTLDASDKKSVKQFLPMVTKLAAVAQAIGCGKVFVRPGDNDDWMQDFAAEYAPLSEKLAAFDVRPLVRLATPVEYRGVSLKKWRGMEPQEWRDMVSLCPGLSFVYSPADLLWLGIDYLLNLPGMVSAIEHIVAHDVEINRTILNDSGLYGPLWWRYRLVGKGQVDWRQFIEALKLYDYQGAFSLQLDDEFIEDESQALGDALDEGKRYLARLLKG
jgi:sugar phosphate isomerase/epimerase